jgi:glyceraldehyde 3-phosphate dehydrogenase
MSKQLNVAINGLGRIGRIALRQIIDNPNLKLVAANSRSPIETYAHLIKYDSLYGVWNKEIGIDKENFIIDGAKIKMLHEKNPADLPWKDLGVDLVIESTGSFTKKAGAEGHIKAGAKRVLISAPAKDDDIKTMIAGINEKDYDSEKDTIISAASCTTTCLAPICKVLNKAYGIKRGFMTTVHAYTNDQNLHDAPHKKDDLRRSRAACESIIPTTTGASEAVAKVIPELQGKLKGISLRVPTITVSVIDLVCEIEKDVDIESLNQTFREEAEGDMKDVLAVSDLPLVSIDYRGNSFASTVDALSTDVLDKRLIKVVAWYDNEWGYVCNMVKLIDYIAKQEK